MLAVPFSSFYKNDFNDLLQNKKNHIHNRSQSAISEMFSYFKLIFLVVIKF